jgi:hypothetical protein
MTTQGAILGGLTAVAVAITVVGLAPHLRAASSITEPTGTWQISAAPGSNAWKLNTTSGELFYCSGISCAPARVTSD